MDLKNGYEIYVNQGNLLPSSSSHDFKAISNWNQGKSIVIDKGVDSKFCTRCNLTIVVFAEVGAIIKFSAKLSAKNKIITAYEMLNDIAAEGEINTYEVNIKK
jgi:hypothetical protein